MIAVEFVIKVNQLFIGINQLCPFNELHFQA